MFKIETQEENGLWHDVRGADGKPLTYATHDEARAALDKQFPVLSQMEKYGDAKRTRVISVIQDDDD